MPMPEAGTTSTNKITKDADPDTASQADTEPLSFDEDADAEGEMDEEEQQQLQTDSYALTNGTDVVVGNPADIEARTADTAMIEQSDNTGVPMDEDTSLQDQPSSHIVTADEEGVASREESDLDADAEGEEEEEEESIVSDDEAQGEDDLIASQATQANLSPSKSQQTGANFSDESDLTDEPDEEGEGDGEDEEEDEDEDEDGEDEEGDEDEAAEGLAALLTAQTQPGDEVSAANDEAGMRGSGLDGLAVLAAAQAGGEESAAEEDTDTDSIAETHLRSSARKPMSSVPRRTATRLNEVVVASPAMSEEDNDEEEEEDDEDEGDEERAMDSGKEGRAPVTSPSKGNREMSSLIGLSSAAKRNAKPGAAGLLAGAPSITVESAAASAATSRAGTPKDEEEMGETADSITASAEAAVAEGEGAGEAAEGEEKAAAELEQEQEQEEIGTPVQDLDEAGPEDETTTDEAALKRQEAMDALTKIEIGFALLRDKLYVERMEEVNQEGEMILQGTHPDLVHLSNLIEVRRERKLELVERWFEQQEKQYERVAKAEEAVAWNDWRNEVVELRRTQTNDIARKRRRLDREKRTLDGPRPARRHQVFETELVRNPDYDRKMQLHLRSNPKKGKSLDGADDMAAYVAFPDLRGAEDPEAWMDMERMGIVTDTRFVPGMGPTFFRPEEMGVDPYAMYGMDQPPVSASSSSGFAVYGAPPPPGEFVPYERHFEGARPGGHNQPHHGYMLDNFGRPISPPPVQHTYGHNQRENRMGDPYAPMTATHHSAHPSNSYANTGKGGGGRRSPPTSSFQDRESKGYSKGNTGTNSGRAHLHQPTSPTGIHRTVTGTAPSRSSGSQYAKYSGSQNAVEDYYNKGSGGGVGTKVNSSTSKHAMPGIRPPPVTAGASSADAGNPYANGRPLEQHMFQR